MECGICSRDLTPNRKPLCTSCAQAALYRPRFQQVTALVDREKSHIHAEAVIRPGNDGVLASLPEDADFDAITGGIKKHAYERTQSEREATTFRIDRVLEHAETLKKQIQEYKEKAAAQKEANEVRRKELATERNELEKHKPRALEPVQSATKKTIQKLDKIRHKTIDARLLLCREAAASSNLQRIKGANGRSEYTLGGIAIPDLRNLNVKTQSPAKATTIGGRTVAEPHELVSEAFENVARLLNISAHYLSVRLPAEVILPHENFPRTVIMPEKSSYKYKDLRFPGLSSSQTSSPAASRLLERNLPRPRPLWLNSPLSQLFKEDLKTYGLYIEGVTLLAWNVAWLCKTQGIEGINTFEDVCAVGRNMWQLLSTHHRKQHRPSLERKATGTSAKPEPARESHIGVFSHNSVQHNLASAGGVNLMKDWKLPTSSRLFDKLKSHLNSEITGAEWDLLEKDEWDEEREDEVPVLVGGSRRPQEESRHAAAMSIMSVAPHDGTEDERGSVSDARSKGNSGWMKVRGRNADF